jgi:hypothetical protein
MAKKSFKSGLGSLIQNSNIEFEDNGVQKGNDTGEKLRFKISQLQEELKLWRTGKLTLEIFEKSLKDNNLSYDPKNNQFTKLK